MWSNQRTDQGQSDHGDKQEEADDTFAGPDDPCDPSPPRRPDSAVDRCRGCGRHRTPVRRRGTNRTTMRSATTLMTMYTAASTKVMAWTSDTSRTDTAW